MALSEYERTLINIAHCGAHADMACLCANEAQVLNKLLEWLRNYGEPKTRNLLQAVCNNLTCKPTPPALPVKPASPPPTDVLTSLPVEPTPPPPPSPLPPPAGPDCTVLPPQGSGK
jgi:hypothetical protein